jgi:spore maturation protein CgeB
MRRALNVPAKLGWPLDLSGANHQLLSIAKQHPFDIIWIDKGLTIRRNTLLRLRPLLPSARFVHFSLDDMSRKHNQSISYLSGIPVYDLHVTNKSYNVPELRSMGARDVLFVNNAFSPDVHRPMNLSESDRESLGGPVGFIGSFEKARAEAIWFLACNGIQVRIWGDGWIKGWRKLGLPDRHPNLKIEGRALFGAEYARIICGFDVNLCFLRKLNRDLQTTRSLEIPACGGFMLAERTAEHEALFTDGKEASFFTTYEELLQKCRYYLAHPLERQSISIAGQQRCVESDYSYEQQLRLVLAKLEP